MENFAGRDSELDFLERQYDRNFAGTENGNIIWQEPVQRKNSATSGAVNRGRHFLFWKSLFLMGCF